jgi:hypothetical protein
MPALVNLASTSSPPQARTGRLPSISPCSANAFNVASGIVLTVNGAARASTYNVSGALGSLVPVLAQRRRWARAPALKIRCPQASAAPKLTGTPRLGLQSFTPALQMVALACYFCEFFCIGTWRTAVFLSMFGYTVASGMGAFRFRSHGGSFSGMCF